MKKDIFAGIALGLLVGGIIGLSIAEVTGLILGTLTSLLTAFFGLRPEKEGESGNKVIIGSFSFVCMLAILGGMYLRNNNSFAPSLEEEISTYKKAQFTTEEIKQIILVKKFGLVPEQYQFIAEAKTKGDQTVLMADEMEKSYLCSAITPQSSLQDLLDAFNDSGSKYASMAHELRNIIKDDDELTSTLIYLKTVICESNQ